MGIRSKITVGLTACLLVASSCHGAEIDLNELLPEAGQAGAGDAPSVGADGGAGNMAGGGGIGAPDVIAGAGGDVGEMAGSGGAYDDLTAPRVLSISPSDGEQGVRSDSKIVIRFSEPMNRARTASASELFGIPATAQWDETGAELSMSPLDELEYGTDEAMEYALRVSRSAMDLAGNALDEEAHATFYTSRAFTMGLPRVQALTGFVIESNDPPSAFVDPVVGDATDLSMKGFITFDLGSLPADTQSVTAAELTVGQYFVRGAPYQMGSMMLEHVAFSAWSFALSAATKVSFGALFSDPEAPPAMLDVTSLVRAQFAEHAQSARRVQFRFRFEEAAYANGKTDEVRLNPVRLAVSFLAP